MELDEIKILLGDSANNFSDAQINLAYKLAINEVEEYCKRDVDVSLKLIAEEIAILKLNRSNTEGLASQGFSGVSESYIDGYPQNIKDALIRKRKVKVI